MVAPAAPVVAVPTHRPGRRQVLPERVYRTEAAKWQAIGARVAEAHASGRPVLLGTPSVAAKPALRAITTDTAPSLKRSNATFSPRPSAS